VDELERMRKENARLQARLAQAETIIEAQKKVASLLGTSFPSPPDEL
jgi:transposase